MGKLNWVHVVLMPANNVPNRHDTTSGNISNRQILRRELDKPYKNKEEHILLQTLFLAFK